MIIGHCPRIKTTICFLFLACAQKNDGTSQPLNTTLTPIAVLEDAFKNQTSNLQVEQQGTIISILPDDVKGDKHQRFIVQLSNNQTLLIAHNIDVAPRVPDPAKGSVLRFYGVYEWNSKGGVVHWTHKDPAGKHVGGWVEYKGKRFE